MEKSFHHWVAAVLQVQLAADIDHRPGVVVLHGNHRERAKHVQHGHCLGGGLHPGKLVRHMLAHLLEQLALQRNGLVVCPQNAVFQFFQLLGDVPLPIGQGLLADVVLRHLVLVAVGHLDVVAEHPVVACFQLGDAGAFPLPGLHGGNQLPASVHVPLHLVQLGVVALPDDSSLPDGEGRVVHDGGIDELGDVLQAVQLAVQLAEQSGLAPRQKLFEPGQALDRRGERAELPAIGGTVHDPGHNALQVENAG